MVGVGLEPTSRDFKSLALPLSYPTIKLDGWRLDSNQRRAIHKRVFRPVYAALPTEILQPKKVWQGKDEKLLLNIGC